MGKKYYCDYCDKTMVDMPDSIKVHNKGLEHQKLLKEHYQQFKKPETILEEESKKIPCSRFKSGTCQFGAVCNFSHYSAEDLMVLRQEVQAKKQKTTPELSLIDLYNKLQNEKSECVQTDTLIVDANECAHILPWKYDPKFESLCSDTLPPSLRKITAENLCFPVVHWG